eukprot:1041382-Rhodomonas_salina.2
MHVSGAHMASGARTSTLRRQTTTISHQVVQFCCVRSDTVLAFAGAGGGWGGEDEDEEELFGMPRDGVWTGVLKFNVNAGVVTFERLLEVRWTFPYGQKDSMRDGGIA